MKCVKCSETMNGCVKCYTNQSCYECNTELILDSLSMQCLTVDEAPSEYYGNKDTLKFLKCLTALENCEECDNNETCTKCMEFSNLDNGVCKSKCDLGRYYDSL